MKHFNFKVGSPTYTFASSNPGFAFRGYLTAREGLVCELFMDPKHVVLDISSDEEVGLDRYRGDDYEWLSDLLREVDKVTDDSDDVVVVGEVNPTQKSKFSKSTAKEDDDDDDDCVVLDGDPDNAVPTVNDSENGSDDLLIVGEKGQVNYFWLLMNKIKRLFPFFFVNPVHVWLLRM